MSSRAHLFGIGKHTAPAHSRTGQQTIQSLDGGPPQIADYVSCKHCGYTSIWVPASATWWGYCGVCHGLTCGRQYCTALPCCHWRQGIDNMEAGRDVRHRPIIASIDFAPPTG